MKLGKKLCKTVKKSFSLVLALTIMLSVCAVSGMSLNVFAATSSGQKIYINLTKNKEWKDFSSVTYRFADDDGTVLDTGTVSKNSSEVFEATAPSGATKIELSSGVNFTLPKTTVAKDFRRIYLYNSNNTYNEAYAYSWVNEDDFNAEWPGVAMTKTSSDSDYYYVDVKSSHKNVIFSNKGETQTSDLGINDSYSADNALYDASKSQWTNPFIKTIDISGATGDTEFYLSTDGSFKESKYLSVQAPDKQSKATYKTVYVSNDDWKSLTKVYATFDYNDAYEGTVELTKDTKDTKVSGSVVFSGKIPAGALLRFHPNELNLNGASSATSYPTGSEYDGSGYSDNTATYVKTARGEGWTKFSEIDNVNYGAVIENSFKDNFKDNPNLNIVGVDATYFDYWSDMEQANGYLQCQGSDNMYNHWYQFDNFNKYISDIALDHQSDWKYPLYFGNMYKGDKHYDTFKTHAEKLTNINDFNDNYYYAVNNSNGMAWGDGNYNQSLQGLMYNTLDSKGNLQVANGVKAPYFDAEALSTATYNDKRVANVYKSSFPFRATTDSDGVTTYEFTSKNATDNIYFTWNGLTPTKINYGAGEQFGVHDELSKFAGGQDGYGVFPFNNTQNTSAGKGTNCNLNYGFGVRLDIDFRVPKDGMLADNKPVTFDFTGDDDLWVYIGEDPTGANAELALDLGGDHKEAKGSINFNTMKATADDVFADYSSSSSSTTVTVPSDEFWVKTNNKYFCLNVWEDTSVGVDNNGKRYVKPYEVSDGFYKFKKSDLGSNTNAIFCKWQNINDGKLTEDLTLSDLYGGMWNDNGTPYTGDAVLHHTNLGTVTKDVNGGNKLDPNKTYHMVVFYMERGEAESNFSVNFTMTPANNDLKVTKALDTGDVVSEISDDLKANEAFDYTIKENDKDTSGKSYKLTKPDKSTSTEPLSNSGFTLKDDYMADFDNSFKTGNDMTVNELTNSSNLKYTTNWELVNNRDGSTISNGSTTNSEFKLVDDKDDSAYAQLQLNYTNSIVTAPLEISKNVVGEDGTTDYETNQQFTFAIALDFDGNGSTYDYKTYPLEYQLKEKGASDYSNTVYRTSKDGSFTIKKGESIKLLNIPVGATYKITEKRVIGYVPYKVGDQPFDDGDSTFVGILAEAGNALNFINKVNPTNIAISVNKTLDGQAYSGSKFVYTLTGLKSMDTAKQDTDGNTIKTNSTALVSQESATPDASGKVEFKDLSLISVGVYRFKITEALAEGVNASDYKMDTNTWLAEIELLEGGEVKGPKYIKVKNSDIEGKTDAQLADYFNNSPSVEKAVFENETTHGSATVNKKNQAGGNVSDTEFAVMKVSEEGIFTADDINTIIKNTTMNTHMTSKKTDSNGQAEFNNLTIFKDGQGEFTKSGGNVVWNSSSDNYLKGTSTYQTYCLFEHKPSEGYTPNYTLSYFTLPVKGEYDVTYEYVDGAITMPSASGDGMNGYFVLGLSVAGLAVTMFTGYAIYYGKGRKKRRARRRK